MDRNRGEIYGCYALFAKYTNQFSLCNFLLYHSFGGICREKENYLIEQENEHDESSVDNRDLNDSFV